MATLPDRFGRVRSSQRAAAPAVRTMADDARAMLLELYGTEGPARCRYTADMFELDAFDLDLFDSREVPSCQRAATARMAAWPPLTTED